MGTTMTALQVPQQHRAAALTKRNERLEVVMRTTPRPGPGQLLVRVDVCAVNPVDQLGRDADFPPNQRFPTVLGGDAGGVVVAAGSGVTRFRPGDRVVAWAGPFFRGGDPDTGAFQQYTLVDVGSAARVAPEIALVDAAVLPVAVFTTFTAFTSILGLALAGGDGHAHGQGLLVWGAASSVGTVAVQAARSLGLRVYATASAANHAYLATLGAHALVDYRDPNAAIAELVEAARRDGVVLSHAVCTVASAVPHAVAVLAALLPGDDASAGAKASRAKVASVDMLPPDFDPAPAAAQGVDVAFVIPSFDEAIRVPHIASCFQWLEENLASGALVPSPPARVVGRGLDAVNQALDLLREGVRCTKLVVPLDQ